jgi:hypothetical protein
VSVVFFLIGESGCVFRHATDCNVNRHIKLVQCGNGFYILHSGQVTCSRVDGIPDQIDPNGWIYLHADKSGQASSHIFNHGLTLLLSKCKRSSRTAQDYLTQGVALKHWILDLRSPWTNEAAFLHIQDQPSCLKDAI